MTVSDRLLLNDVADIVKDLACFASVRELIRTHIARWRKKYATILRNLDIAEAKLTAAAPRKRPTKKSAADNWPTRRVYHKGLPRSGKLVPVPPELNRKVLKREVRTAKHALALSDMREWTPSERFTMLALIHDAKYTRFPIGPTAWSSLKKDGHSDYVVNVWEVAKTSDRTLTTAEADTLESLVDAVLDRIEATLDPLSKDENGKSLHAVVERSRRRLAKLANAPPQSFVSSAERATDRQQQRVIEAADDDNGTNKPTSRLDTPKKIRQSSKPRNEKAGRPRVAGAKEKRDLALFDDWQTAKDARTTAKEFCKDKGIKQAELDRVVDWVAKRRKREQL